MATRRSSQDPPPVPRPVGQVLEDLGRKMTAEEMAPIHAELEALRRRPKRDDGQPTLVTPERVRAYLNKLKAMGHTNAVDVYLKAGGHIL